MRYRLTLFLVFGAILAGLAEKDAGPQRAGFASGIDGWWLDFCVGNTRHLISDPAVTLVRINDEYEPAIGDRLSQADYAAILRFIEPFEPQALAFEPNPVFDESALINQTTLELLREAALTLPPLTLGALAESGQPPQSPEEEPAFPVLEQVEGNIERLTEITRVVASPNPQLLANGEPAFTGIELGGDQPGLSRRITVIARQGEAVVPSLIVHALARHAGVPLSEVRVKLPPAAKSGEIAIGEAYRIPVDVRGRMKLHEHSGVGVDFFPSVSAFHLALTGEDDEEIRQLLGGLESGFESLRSNLVLVGHDRAEDRREKVSNARRQLSRSELLARAIATVQSGRYIDWWPRWVRLLSLGVIAAFAVFAFRLPRRQVVLWSLLGAFLYFGISMLVFRSTLAWAPPFAPLALFALMLLLGLALPDPAKSAAKEAAEGPAPDAAEPGAGLASGGAAG